MGRGLATRGSTPKVETPEPGRKTSTGSLLGNSLLQSIMSGPTTASIGGASRSGANGRGGVGTTPGPVGPPAHATVGPTVSSELQASLDKVRSMIRAGRGAGCQGSGKVIGVSSAKLIA